jgi:hypothetical protein
LDTDETTKITALAERAGMIGFAMFSWGHIHDKTTPPTRPEVQKTL